MVVLRFICALVAAIAVAAAVEGWLRRQGGPGMGPSPLRPRSRQLPPWLTLQGLLPWQSPRFRLHVFLLTGSALVFAWACLDETGFGYSQSLLLLFVLYPLAFLDWVTLEVDLRLVFLALLVRLALLLAFDRPRTPEAVMGMLAGAGMITLASLAYRAVRGRTGLGEGDAGVLAVAGAYIGWTGLVPVLLLAAATGALVGLVVLVVQRKPLDTPIPFVPFLCAAALLVHLAQRIGWHMLALG